MTTKFWMGRIQETCLKLCWDLKLPKMENQIFEIIQFTPFCWDPTIHLGSYCEFGLVNVTHLHLLQSGGRMRELVTEPSQTMH